jgi:hypothetical protein
MSDPESGVTKDGVKINLKQIGPVLDFFQDLSIQGKREGSHGYVSGSNSVRENSVL